MAADGLPTAVPVQEISYQAEDGNDAGRSGIVIRSITTPGGDALAVSGSSPRVRYRPGDIVQGEFYCFYDIPADAKVYVELSGEEKAQKEQVFLTTSSYSSSSVPQTKLLTFTEPIIRRRQRQKNLEESSGALPFSISVPRDVVLPGSINVREKQIQEGSGMIAEISYCVSIAVVFANGIEDTSPPIPIWLDEIPPAVDPPTWEFASFSIGDDVHANDLPMPSQYYSADGFTQALRDAVSGGRIGVEILPISHNEETEERALRAEGDLGVSQPDFNPDNVSDKLLFDRLARKHPLRPVRHSVSEGDYGDESSEVAHHPFFGKRIPLVVSAENRTFSVMSRLLSFSNGYKGLVFRVVRRVEVAPNVFSPVGDAVSSTGISFKSWKAIKTIELGVLKTEPLSPFTWGQFYYDVEMPVNLSPSSTLGRIVRIVDSVEVSVSESINTTCVGQIPIFHLGDESKPTMSASPFVLSDLPMYPISLFPSRRYQNIEFRPRWVHDSEVKGCMGCGKEFNLFRRRHHCRNCCEVLCGGCCGTQMEIQNLLFPVRVRVCQRCAPEVHGGGRMPRVRAPDGTPGLSAMVAAVSPPPPVDGSRAGAPITAEQLRGQPSSSTPSPSNRAPSSETAAAAPAASGSTSAAPAAAPAKKQSAEKGGAKGGMSSNQNEIRVAANAPADFKIGYGPLSYRTPAAVKKAVVVPASPLASESATATPTAAAEKKEGEQHEQREGMREAYVPEDSDEESEEEGRKGKGKGEGGEADGSGLESAIYDVVSNVVKEEGERLSRLSRQSNAGSAEEKKESESASAEVGLRVEELKLNETEEKGGEEEEEEEEEEGVHGRSDTVTSVDSAEFPVPPPPPAAKRQMTPA